MVKYYLFKTRKLVFQNFDSSGGNGIVLPPLARPATPSVVPEL